MSEGLLWTGLDLIKPLDARVTKLPRGVTGVSIDTRTIEPGDLFFAIKGENSDGHAYVETAFAKGAAAAVVDEAHADRLKSFGPLYVVQDVLAAMERLGIAARKRSGAMIVAITGSVGKTSTKEALRLALSRTGVTHASAASYNNHLGVPLTLCRMPANAEFGVFEIGMNHAEEIRPLVAMVRPHVALITNIAPVHLENLGSIEAIADAKGEIFSGLEPGGIAILPRETEHYDRLAELAGQSRGGGILSFGETDAADAQMIDFSPQADGSIVSADIMGVSVRYRIGAPGRHLATNSLAVLLAARAVGADIAEAARAMAEFSAPKGRGEQVALHMRGGDATLIDESYNANPVSMRAALRLLADAPKDSVFGQRVAILGDMLELGPEAADLHAGLASFIAELPIDVVHAAGPLMRHLYDALPEEKKGVYGRRSEDIAETLLASVAAGDVVMVKGSNGSRMGPIVAALKERYATAPDELVS
ncbi:MAG: UDP-N-acetylmuramoylalanyl-D-glutamyl-2,6-diaminopimelate--D-alanyl-D-alanine ligase [Beijerinckiaceae bacterium]|nr:UDP-N-acetylmuramoylalanyl-D-glutamyl-2,6-diaminopimelate--D-alanyl-D-alanine ligase [Beijerinckiaceae bacterium]